MSWLIVGGAVVVVVVMLISVYLFYPALVAAVAPHIVWHELDVLSLTNAAHSKDRSSSSDVDTSITPSETTPVLLSLIIPAYNEEERLTAMLQEAYDYLILPKCPAMQTLAQAIDDDRDSRHNTMPSPVVEFILVDDGSTDATVQVYRDFCQDKNQDNNTNNPPPQQSSSSYPSKNTRNSNSNSAVARIRFRLVRLPKNCGKGAAVQAGMLAATSKTAAASFMLMVDADGATTFGPGLVALAAYAATHDAVLGSRAVTTTNTAPATHTSSSTTATTTVQRSRIRQFLQAGFHWLVVFLVGTNIQDTQCGFKLWRGRHVPALFGHLHLRRWAFDTELLTRATAGLGLRLAEVPVPWHEVAGSKLHTGPLSLVRVAVGMLRDMLCVRLCYTLGVWQLPTAETTTTSNQAKKDV